MKHDWKMGLLLNKPEWITCAKCGVVQNQLNINKECKGVVRITLKGETIS